MSKLPKPNLWALLALLTVVAAVGCGKKEPAIEAPAPLASVNGVAITEEDFSFEVQRRVESGRPLGDAQSILKELIERQVMLQKAESSGVLDEPQVKRELENRQMGQWLDRSLQVERDAVRVSDEELRDHYASSQNEYTRPEMVRLAILFRRVNTLDPDESTASIQEELEKGRAAYLAEPAEATHNGRIIGFGNIAVNYSEDTVSRYRGGDIGWVELGSAAYRHPNEVIDAGAALETGAVSDVISTDEGLYVVMKIDQRAAQVTPFEEAVPGLRRRLIREKQEMVERTFMSNLMAEARVDINPEKAGKLTIPAIAVPEPPVLTPLTDMAPNRETR